MLMIIIILVLIIVIIYKASHSKNTNNATITTTENSSYCESLDTVINLLKPMITGAEKGGSRNATSIQVLPETRHVQSGVHLIIRHPLSEDDEFKGTIRRAFETPQSISPEYYQLIVEKFELTQNERDAYIGSSASEFYSMIKGENVGFYSYDPMCSFPVLVYEDSVTGWSVDSCLKELDDKCKKLFPEKLIGINMSNNSVTIR